MIISAHSIKPGRGEIMNTICKKEILNELYEKRKKEFEVNFKDKYQKAKEIQAPIITEEILIKKLKSIINSNDELEIIVKHLEEFKDAEAEELEFWNKLYYKNGFIDAMNLKDSIKESKIGLIDKLFTCSIDDIIEERRYNVWYLNTEYKNWIYNISEIKNKYPNVRDFLDNNQIVELSKEETNAINEINDLKKKIENFEKVETIKYIIKEIYLL